MILKSVHASRLDTILVIIDNLIELNPKAYRFLTDTNI